MKNKHILFCLHFAAIEQETNTRSVPVSGARFNKGLQRGWRKTVCAMYLLSATLLMGACSSGPMKVYETSYLAVPSGDNTNFYRVTVSGNTELGISNYNSSWFPADTLDRLYGGTTKTDAPKALNTEEDIKGLINTAILKTTKGYLKAAANPNSSEETIVSWLNAQRRVRAMAGDGITLPKGAVEVEYDPSRNLALRHSGEKLVFILASDPRKVINSIKGFANDTKSSASILRLADVVRQQRLNETDRAEAKMAVEQQTNNTIVSQIDGVLERLKSPPNKQTLQAEIDALLLLIESAK